MGAYACTHVRVCVLDVVGLVQYERKRYRRRSENVNRGHRYPAKQQLRGFHDRTGSPKRVARYTRVHIRAFVMICIVSDDRKGRVSAHRFVRGDGIYNGVDCTACRQRARTRSERKITITTTHSFAYRNAIIYTFSVTVNMRRNINNRVESLNE